MENNMNLKKVQEEMVAWQQHNFPGRPDWIPLLGAVEEMGELMEATMKEDVPEVLDAIGDIGIYLCDFANSQGYDLYELATAEWTNIEVDSTFNLGNLVVELGKLSHSFIKTFQKIRMSENHQEQAKRSLGRIISILDEEAVNWGSSLEDVLEATWSRVKQRDWQKNRDTAHKQ